MTICIAAICADRKEVLLASDRMVTISFPSTEFEHDTAKFIKITDRCYMGTADDPSVPAYRKINPDQTHPHHHYRDRSFGSKR